MEVADSFFPRFGARVTSFQPASHSTTSIRTFWPVRPRAMAERWRWPRSNASRKGPAPQPGARQGQLTGGEADPNTELAPGGGNSLQPARRPAGRSRATSAASGGFTHHLLAQQPLVGQADAIGREQLPARGWKQHRRMPSPLGEGARRAGRRPPAVANQGGTGGCHGRAGIEIRLKSLRQIRSWAIRRLFGQGLQACSPRPVARDDPLAQSSSNSWLHQLPNRP